MSLSVVIIAKDAEGEIADAISSVDFADETIVVDNGSTDRTVEVATYLKAKVFTSSSSNFSTLRNVGLQKGNGEWILYIDTDERVTDELADNIKSVIKGKESGVSAYRIRRKNFYFCTCKKTDDSAGEGRHFGNHEWPYIEKIERLFRRDSLKGWRGELHESPIVDGKIGELEGFLLHYTHRDLTSMLAKTIVWSKVEAQLRFKANHPPMTWWRFFRVMLTAFIDSYIKQGGWKVGVVGLLESIYQSFSIFVTYARLWELQNRKRK